MSKQVVRFYDPKTVDDFAKRLVRDKGEQVRPTNALRQTIAALLGDDLRFSTFSAKIETKDKFVEILELTCVRTAEERLRNRRGLDTHAGENWIL